jgi:hypothetical protein
MFGVVLAKENNKVACFILSKKQVANASGVLQ